MPPSSSIDLSVHPRVFAALREDAQVTGGSDDSPLSSSPLAAWLIGVAFREAGSEKTSTRILGVVRSSCSSAAAGRTLSEDLAATTALLPGGVSVVGAAGLASTTSSSSSSPPHPPPSSSSSLADLALAAAKAARAAGGASAGSVSTAADSQGQVVWFCEGEQVEVVEEKTQAAAPETTTAATATATAKATATATTATPLSPAVAALSAGPEIDPWLCERFSAVRCGPLRVSRGVAGAAACLAELCGDGDDPGDAVFVVVGGSEGGASPPRGRPLLLAGDGPAPSSSSLLSPLLAAPHACPPPPPPPVSLRRSSSSSSATGPPPAPTAVFEPASASPSSCELVLDALALYPKTSAAAEAAAALRVALSRQLRTAMAMTTMRTTPSSSPSSSSPSPSPPSSSSLRALPFLLPGLPVFVTPLMPVASKEKKEKEKKKKNPRNAAGEEEGKRKEKKKEGAGTAAAAASASAARAALGKALRLPPGLPLLRPSAAFAFPKKGNKKRKSGSRREKLLDVHLSLPSFSSSSSSSSRTSPSPLSPLSSFEAPLPATPTLSFACVAGSYRYHHYGQDGTDDRGWGCAYRSLQTLWSWFAENHFLSDDDDDDDDDDESESGDDDGSGRSRRRRPSTSPPSHAEIQRALVSLGDKPPSFVGSDQWIGALEISFVLESLAGIQSKVLTVPSGKEMASSAAAGALVTHFQKQGTPVMIGGGVLAYTCLGACYDSASGEASFLILDPHYCGNSDVAAGAGGDSASAAPAAASAAAAAAVVKGGWVAWRKPGDSAAAGGPLFVEDAFYNLLCPQRPETV